MRQAVTTICFVAVVAVLGILAWMLDATVNAAPRGWRLEAVRLPDASTPVSLDWKDLGQTPGVDTVNPSRLLVAKDGRGWVVANGSRRRIWLRLADGGTRDLAAVPLKPGDELRIGTATIRVEEATRQHLSLRSGDGRTATWSKADGRLEVSGGYQIERCTVNAGESWRARLDKTLETVIPGPLSHKSAPVQIFTLGGAVDCPERWRQDFEAESLRILAHGDQFYVLQDREAVNTRLTRADGTTVDLEQPWVPVDDGTQRISALGIGGVRYAVEEDGGQLVLRPVGRRGLFPQPLPDTPGRLLEWQSMESGDWLGGGLGIRQLHDGYPELLWGLGALAALAATAVLFRPAATPSVLAYGWRPFPERLLYSVGGIVAAGACGIALALPGLDCTLVLALCGLTALWATAVLALNGDLHGARAVAWLAVVIMAGGGLLGQMQLASLMHSETLIGIPRKTALGLTCISLAAATSARLHGGAVVATIALILGDRAPEGWHQRLMAVFFRWVAPLALLLLLLIQVARGSEAGIGMLQPSEFAKAGFVFSLAWIGTWFLFHARVNHYATPWPRIIGRLMVGAALLCLAIPLLLLLVNDMSPILILAVIALVWLLVLCMRVQASLKGRPAAAPWITLPRGLAVLTTVALAALVAAAAFRPDLFNNLAGGKVRERFAILEAPLDHPAAYQVAMAFAVVSEAPTVATPDRVFGTNSREVRLLPEVENDMIIAYLLSKWGSLPVAALIAVQAAWVLAFSRIAWCALHMTGSSEQRLAANFIGLAMVGIVTCHALHWTIGVLNSVSGIVMGQPTTFLSSGTSHTIAIGMSGVVLAMLRWK